MSSNGTSDLARRVLAAPEVVAARAAYTLAQGALSAVKSQDAKRGILAAEAEALGKEIEDLEYAHQVLGQPRDVQLIGGLREDMMSKRAALAHMRPLSPEERAALEKRVGRARALLSKLAGTCLASLAMPPVFKVAHADVDGLLRECSTNDFARAELKQALGVGVALEDKGLVEALQVVWCGPLGQPRWLSPAAKAEMENIAAARRERCQAENAQRYAEEEERLRHVKGLSAGKRRAILDQEAERLGVVT